MTIKKPNKFIELIKNILHIYSAKTYKDGSTVFCDYIKNVYYVTGELKSECPYTNGEKHGIEIGYYENGKLQFETPYENGKKHGIWKWHYKTGELRAELSYKNGEIDGIKYHER